MAKTLWQIFADEAGFASADSGHNQDMTETVKLRKGNPGYDVRYYVDVDGVTIGWVIRKSATQWTPVIAEPHSLIGRVGWDCSTRREAIDELLIMRRV